jgi:hypothetical protein
LIPGELYTGLQVSFTGICQAEEAAEHPFVLGQLEGGLDGEAGLEEGGLSGTDGDRLLSAKVGCCWLLLS